MAQAARAGTRGWGRERAAAAAVHTTLSAGTYAAGTSPLLVLHLVAREPAYGNRLIESIEEITQGTISVNPNTMYPLLREMEGDGARGPLGAARPADPAVLLDHPRRPAGIQATPR